MYVIIEVYGPGDERAIAGGTDQNVCRRAAERRLEDNEPGGYWSLMGPRVYDGPEGRWAWGRYDDGPRLVKIEPDVPYPHIKVMWVPAAIKLHAEDSHV